MNFFRYLNSSRLELKVEDLIITDSTLNDFSLYSIDPYLQNPAPWLLSTMLRRFLSKNRKAEDVTTTPNLSVRDSETLPEPQNPSTYIANVTTAPHSLLGDDPMRQPGSSLSTDYSKRLTDSPPQKKNSHLCEFC